MAVVITQTKEGPKAAMRQFVIGFSAHFGGVLTAMVWCWSSTALPSLRHSKFGGRTISNDEEAWVASIAFLAGAIGSIAMGSTSQYIGFRKNLIVCTIPVLFGWLAIAWAPTVFVILLARFILGFFIMGIGTSAAPLMGEISHDTRRGRINFCYDLQFCLGAFIVYIVGCFVGWQGQCFVFVGFCSVYLGLTLTFVPDTPQQLIKEGNKEKAIETLKYIRDSDNVDCELEQIQKAVLKSTDGESRMEPSRIFARKNTAALKGTLIATMLQIFLQLSGVVPISNYAVDVFKAANPDGTNENICTIILGFVNLVATFIALLFVDKYGRRRLFIVSEIILVATLSSFALYLSVKDCLGSAGFWNWFPLCALTLYVIGYSVGVGPLPWVIIGEILSPDVKGFSSGFVNVIARISAFLVMQYFKDLSLYLGQPGVYSLFAICCGTGGLFVYFFLPETNGKPAEVIQMELKRYWFHNRQPKTSSPTNESSREDPQLPSP